MKKNYNLKKVLIASIITIVFILSLVGGFAVGSNLKKKPVTNNQNEKLVEQTKDEEKSNTKEYKENNVESKIENKEVFNTIQNTKQDVKVIDNKIAENTEEENYSKEYKEYLEKTDEEKKEIEVVPRKKEVKEEEIETIIEKEQEIIEEKNQEPVQEKENINPKTGLPYTFNLKDIIPIKVGSQKSYGLCWDFSSMKCVETNLALTQGKYYDFSEIHVDYLTSKLMTKSYRDVHEGGNFEIFMEYTQQFNGFIEEEKLEYRDYSEDEYMTFINMDKIDESVYECVDFPYYNKINNSDWTEEDFIQYQNAIKKHIMNFGSLYFSTEGASEDVFELYSSDFKDVEENSERKCHAMSIVGWDDNYPKEKFTSATGKHPEKDGAYIVLNSWGEDYGDNGYCYISYEDYFVHRDLSGVISTNKKDLINLSTLKNKAIANYLEREYKDKILVYNNSKYLNKLNLDKYEYDLSNLGLTNLDDIEIFENAGSLNLSNNKLTDVSKLNNSKLKKLHALDLSNNPDISGWENLTNVNILTLRNCNITDISGLNSWANKEYIDLDLSDNPNLAGLETLKNLNISSLKLANCNIKDLSEFENKTVWELDLSGNKEITNIEKLNEYPTLYNLILKDCDIKDASIFENIKQIKCINLSENKGIKNVNKVNTEFLSLESCDIETVEEFTDLNMYYSLNLKNNKIKDVTPLNNVMLQELYLSGNADIAGDLSNSRINLIEIDNCNLDDNFNFFNLESIQGLYLRGNNITLQNALNKIDFNYLGIDETIKEEDLSKLDLKEDMMLNNLTIEKTVKIPKGNLRIFLPYVVEGYIGNNKVTVENGTYNSTYKYVDFNANNTSKVIIENYNDWDKHICEVKLIINFVIDDTMKPTKLVATKPLTKSVYDEGEKFTSTGLKVAELYGKGIYKNINDYQLIVPEFFKFGENEIKIVKDNIEGIVKIRYLGIENEKDIFTLTFKTQELFENVALWLNNEVLIVDKNNKTVILRDSAKTILKNSNIYVSDNSIYDIDSLKELEIFSVTIVYDGDKITLDDLKIIKDTFPNMTKIYVENNTYEPDESVIPEQNLFEILVYNTDDVG